MAAYELQIPEAGQHFVECVTKNCKKNCQFYCNPCHLSLCEQCKGIHLKSQDTKNHEVVRYRQRKLQLPVQKCKDHPTKNIDILCNECNIPLCSKCCTIQDHWGHRFVDLETIYSDNCVDCQEKIVQIHQYFNPTSLKLRNETKDDATEIEKVMENIRAAIVAEAESLKSLVDVVASENIDHVNRIEESLNEIMKKQDKTYDDYISYLNKVVETFHRYLSLTEFQNNPMLFPMSENMKIQPIPETTKPVPPSFTAGTYNKEEVAKLLGRVNVSNAIPEIEKISSSKTALEQTIPEEKRGEENRKKSHVKQKMSLSSSVTKVRELQVPFIDRAYHMSVDDKAGVLWVSNTTGNLVQLGKRETSGGYGYHVVTQNGDLIYTDKDMKVINRITSNNKISEITKTGEWEPISICSSYINRDILIGLKNNGKAKVTRYNKSGQEIQNIQRDNMGQELYSDPYYITENINGDICTSDHKKQEVVVVKRSGQHRFSYRGQESTFRPFGICTDVLGHIIVCDEKSETVHLLDRDGLFLCHLLTLQHGVKYLRSVCLDDANNLCVGQRDSNIISVYKYLQ